jgi:pimeloyl-ACP methyl ester carboxylesterase
MRVRDNVAFEASDGTTLRGWHYSPGASPARGAIVMAHGITSVKEMWLDRFAEVFCEAGLHVLVYDHRNLGESEGQPRQEIDPWAQIRDYRDAITFAETLPGVDAARMGLWGSSYSGGHVLVVAAFDRRVRCVVSQVPVISVRENLRRYVRPDMLAATRAMFDADRRARFAGQPPAMFPVVDEDPAAPSLLPTADSFKWFTETARSRAPNWRNEVTLRSVEMASEYEPGLYIRHVSPTPLLLIVDTADSLAPADLALDAYERALHPKKLVLLNGGHFAAYIEDFPAASVAARDWFVQHLGPG